MTWRSFDPRWVAAEAAGVRTVVDRWFGPCLVTARRHIAPFDLGFSPEASVPFRIRSVKAGSTAARAGLRPGDLVLSLDAAGQSSSVVRVTIERAGRSFVFEYFPRGTPRPGHVVLARRGCGFG